MMIWAKYWCHRIFSFMANLHRFGGRRSPMSWNYRLIKRVQNVGKNEYVTYGIHETYYNDKGEPFSITERPVEPYGENATEILASWMRMGEAFTKPILEYDDLVNRDVQDMDDLEDFVSLKNITFKHDEKPLTKKEIIKFKNEHEKERQLSEIIYSNECIDKPLEKVISFALALLKNGTVKK